MNETLRRVARLYHGAGAAFWDRIELERPASYLEENVVLGRQREAALLRQLVGDAGGRRILDAGCGRGRFALELASVGARVLAADLVPRFSRRTLAAARRGEITLVATDFRNLLAAGGETGFDLILLREVVQDYTEAEQEKLFAALTGGGERLLLTLRLESRWTPLEQHNRPPGLAETVDPTKVLRRLHLRTSFRLVRQQEIRRRNFRSQVIEMVRFE